MAMGGGHGSPLVYITKEEAVFVKVSPGFALFSLDLPVSPLANYYRSALGGNWVTG